MVIEQQTDVVTGLEYEQSDKFSGHYCAFEKRLWHLER